VPPAAEIEPSKALCWRHGVSYSAGMGGFFSSLFDEMAARRRRMRASLGDRGQAIAEFLVLGGVLVGSLGLFVREWMPSAAPWGFAIPLMFLIGYGLIDYRRQAAAGRDGADHARVSASYDWIALLWSFGCALAGAAAFVIAWSAEPPPAPEEPVWAPPENSVPVDILP
jgi:hypothetical protein